VTSAGDLVLGEQGPIAMPAGVISISPDGTLSADGAMVDKLRVIQFASDSTPIAIGKSYYSVAANQVGPASDSYVRQGTLESSNVNAMAAMVDLIDIQRKAEMLERAMSAFQSNLDHIAASDLPHV